MKPGSKEATDRWTQAVARGEYLEGGKYDLSGDLLCVGMFAKRYEPHPVRKALFQIAGIVILALVVFVVLDQLGSFR